MQHSTVFCFGVELKIHMNKTFINNTSQTYIKTKTKINLKEVFIKLPASVDNKQNVEMMEAIYYNPNNSMNLI